MFFLKLRTARCTAPVTKHGEDGLELTVPSSAADTAAVTDRTLAGKLQPCCVDKRKQRSRQRLREINFHVKGQ